MVSAQAQVTTDPVGFVKTTVLGNSDGLVSVPFSRAPSFMGLVQGVAADTITVAGAPFNGNDLSEAYYVRILTGAKRGVWTTILSNGDNTLTVEDAGALNGVAQGDRFGVYPHQTLDSIFPASLAGIAYQVTTSPLSRKTEVLAMDLAGQGINRSPLSSYYYYNGAWRLVGGSAAEDQGGTVLYPETPMMVRNKNNAQNLSCLTLGHVVMSAVGRGLPTLSIQNDLFGATGRPVTMTLNELQLGGTPAFVSTTSTLSRKDQLLVFDNAEAGQNKSPVATYYYLNAAGNVGWRLVGGSATADVGDDPVLELGSGFIIRKVAGTPGNEDWISDPPY
jgi:uncharacterized protein (TIGR02597 family)